MGTEETTLGSNNSADQTCQDVDHEEDSKRLKVDPPAAEIYPGIDADLQEKIDFVFAVDHLIEIIIANLETQDLRNARLVSLRWAQFCSKQLQRKILLKFTCGHTIDPQNRNYYCKIKEKSLPLQDMSDLMTSNSLILNPVNIDFPIKAFVFTQGDLMDTNLQDFIQTQGCHLINLVFRLTIPDTLLELYSHIENLVLNQAPKLKFLKYEINCEEFVREEVEEGDEGEPVPVPVPLITKKSENGENITSVNLKLKTLKFSKLIPQKLFKALLPLAPNLEEVSVPMQCYSFFLQPFLYPGQSPGTNTVTENNTLHLLKAFQFKPTEWNFEFYEQMLQSKNLRLKRLFVDASHLYWEPVEFTESGEWPRATAMVNKIFHDQASSLENLELYPIMFLSRIDMPRMVKLKVIYFSTSTYLRSPSRREAHTPRAEENGKLDWKEKFPRLRTIVFNADLTNSLITLLGDDDDDDDHYENMMAFLSELFFDFRPSPPKVQVAADADNHCETEANPSPSTSSDLKTEVQERAQDRVISETVKLIRLDQGTLDSCARIVVPFSQAFPNAQFAYGS